MVCYVVLVVLNLTIARYSAHSQHTHEVSEGGREALKQEAVADFSAAAAAATDCAELTDIIKKENNYY